MKALIFLAPLLLINSCKTQTNSTSTTENTTTQTVVSVSKTPCPEDGNCTIEVLKNKTLRTETDGTGALYPIVADGENVVVVFNFEQKGPAGTVDGDYSESIHFEIPASSRLLELEGETLENANLLFGKQCYCKGEAGFYRITDGSLRVERTEAAMQVDLQFRVDETSHKVSRVIETIAL